MQLRIVDYDDDSDSSEDSPPPRGHALRIAKYDDDSDSSEEEEEEEEEEEAVQEGRGYDDLGGLLRAHAAVIDPHTQLGPVEHLHVIAMDEPSLLPLEDKIRAILRGEVTGYRLNASFNYVLMHRTTGRYRFFYGK